MKHHTTVKEGGGWRGHINFLDDSGTTWWYYRTSRLYKTNYGAFMALKDAKTAAKTGNYELLHDLICDRARPYK